VDFAAVLFNRAGDSLYLISAQVVHSKIFVIQMVFNGVGHAFYCNDRYVLDSNNILSYFFLMAFLSLPYIVIHEDENRTIQPNQSPALGS
jgi:hypothetical protein